MAHAFSQTDYMSAAYGDPKFWHECSAYWVCGSPNGTEMGSEPHRKPNIDRAQQLMRESGYDGRPVVLIGGSDIPAYQRLSLVTVDLLQKIGFKVDLQLSDWSTGGAGTRSTPARTAHSSSPLTSPSTITTCDGKNFPGWPCDQVEEGMRLRYIREPDATKRMALLQNMHLRLWEVISYLPLGQFVTPFLWRSNISGVLRSNVLAFWKLVRVAESGRSACGYCGQFRRIVLPTEVVTPTNIHKLRRNLAPEPSRIANLRRSRSPLRCESAHQ